MSKIQTFKTAVSLSANTPNTNKTISKNTDNRQSGGNNYAHTHTNERTDSPVSSTGDTEMSGSDCPPLALGVSCVSPLLISQNNRRILRNNRSVSGTTEHSILRRTNTVRRSVSAIPCVGGIRNMCRDDKDKVP